MHRKQHVLNLEPFAGPSDYQFPPKFKKSIPLKGGHFSNFSLSGGSFCKVACRKEATFSCRLLSNISPGPGTGPAKK